MQLAPVTGGNRGLGRSIVEALADDGVDAVFTYRSPEKEAKEVVEAVAARGRHARALRLDITEITAFADFTPPCVRHCGRFDTAGGMEPGELRHLGQQRRLRRPHLPRAHRRAELIRFGIDTTIVVPGAYPSGTNHFHPRCYAADKERRGRLRGPLR
ncbi:SDR family NAD(P)-dependent oxidoreductase [Streptomyces sp. T1317-0309]|nr:SDR family NAD(P)-dependent oxidoreductase [Streptomyces sp. T1317-0309]